jgi:hypothetical protein
MRDAARITTALLNELLHGPQPNAAWILNPGDPGLLRSLERLDAAAASQPPPGGGSCIAAHVDHLCYGFEMLERWSRGENPFSDANFAASWDIREVSEDEYRALLERLRRVTENWIRVLEEEREVTEFELTGIVASAVHLAYHIGAIRQIHPAARGPKAED